MPSVTDLAELGHRDLVRLARPPRRAAATDSSTGAVSPGTAAASAGPMRASGVPTGTVSPGGTRTCSSTPSYGLGISESTLSVDTSNSGSSNATASPTSLSQRPTVPSVTDSPSFGIVISCTASAIECAP